MIMVNSGLKGLISHDSYFNPSPAETVHTQVEASFKRNKIPLKLIKQVVMDV